MAFSEHFGVIVCIKGNCNFDLTISDRQACAHHKYHYHLLGWAFENLSELNIQQKMHSAATDCALSATKPKHDFIHRCCTTGCCTHAEKMTHLLVTLVSTEPEEGLHVGMWPPSPLPSCSQMSLSSPKLQVLSPASLSGLNKALGEREGGKTNVSREKKRGGSRMQDRTLCNWLVQSDRQGKSCR